MCDALPHKKSDLRVHPVHSVHLRAGTLQRAGKPFRGESVAKAHMGCRRLKKRDRRPVEALAARPRAPRFPGTTG